MAPRSAPPDRGQAGLGEDPAEASLGDLKALALGEEVGQVGSVDVAIATRRELHEPATDGVIDPVRRHPSDVAVDQCGRPLGAAVPGDQAPDGADRDPQHAGRLLAAQLAGPDVVQDQQPSLRSGIQRDCLPRLHGLEGDKVAGRLWVTESLAVHTSRAIG